MIPGRPGRFGVNVHFRAISCRCHRRIVSGVTIVATWRKTRRPSRRPFAARRRRWSSVSRRRRPLSCSFRTRFSSTRYSMTCCWWRLTHPARVTSSTCKGVEIGRHRPILPGLTPYRVRGSTEYSDTTGDLWTCPGAWAPASRLACWLGRRPPVSIWCAACPAVFSGLHGPAPGARGPRSAGSSCRPCASMLRERGPHTRGTPCPSQPLIRALDRRAGVSGE